MWHMSDSWGWSMLMSALVLAGFWVALIWTVVNVTRRAPGRQAPAANQAPTAMEILERRYASGELTDEEFEAKRAHLRDSQSREPSGTTRIPGRG